MSVKLRKKKRGAQVKECEAGGVGNPAPASMAAMTAADQCSPACIGSGDNFGQVAPVASKMKVVKIRKKK